MTDTDYLEKRLRQLQTDIYRAGKEWDENYYADFNPRLTYALAEDEGLYEIAYFGNSESAWGYMMEFLCDQENTDKILSLSFDAPDDGENGTTTWDFSELANSDVMLPAIKSLRVKLTKPGDHNQSIVQESYGAAGENGMIAKMLTKMSVLEELTVPSAPDKDFFKIPAHNLRKLTIQVGYDDQDFIENLSHSNNFPQLNVLDFSDRLYVHADRSDNDDSVDFDSFEALFRSDAFKTVKHFTLQNTILSKEEVFALQDIRPDLQFLWVDGRYARYVSHLIPLEKNENADLKAVIEAAQKGDLKAQEQLVSWYSTGEVVGEKNEYQQLYWRHMAADNGSAHSAFMLAQYHYGLKDGMAYNPDLAKHYYRIAADGGFEPARERLQKWDDEHGKA